MKNREFAVVFSGNARERKQVERKLGLLSKLNLFKIALEYKYDLAYAKKQGVNKGEAFSPTVSLKKVLKEHAAKFKCTKNAEGAKSAKRVVLE